MVNKGGATLFLVFGVDRSKIDSVIMFSQNENNTFVLVSWTVIA